MKGKCNECKHGITAWSDNNKELEKQGYSKTGNSSLALGEHYVKCNIGHNEKNLKWWKENGKKTDNLDLLDCFEPTDIAISSQKMLDLVNEMIDFFDKNNNEVK